ncbi:GNAT family N-acetyltransferase [Phaeacidiphilus oryzae]|jgi:RimJ/RimL family protein N-acetyltransferase|uniref:GNAT family N-acetyltransferase n=1 Tax=Phaeacidiphilus oryzae TaxID=348818 RepID=UPI00055E6D7E|nr:GNAT family N-acetyltransferase [Phaeacidiphilus oryzae]
MLLRDVSWDDVDVYVRMRCDPEMMAELGGPLPREGIAEKVAADVLDAASGKSLIKMIVPDEADPGGVAGSVVLWRNDRGDAEIGWMVLPRFQNRGLGRRAVRQLLDEAAAGGTEWGPVHAFPGATNVPSNGICRALGFRFLEECEVDFAGRRLRANHWVLDSL